MKAKIALSLLTRKYCKKIIDVPDDFESWSENKKDNFIYDVFVETVKNGYGKEWVHDSDWGYEEGKHRIIKILK